MRNLAPQRCPTCKQWILVGLDSDLCAFPARIDIEPIDALGETLAIITSRATYTVERRGNQASLTATRRNRWSIHSQPPGAASLTPYDVNAEHVCSLPLPKALTRLAIQARQENPDDQHCPF